MGAGGSAESPSSVRILSIGSPRLSAPTMARTVQVPVPRSWVADETFSSGPIRLQADLGRSPVPVGRIKSPRRSDSDQPIAVLHGAWLRVPLGPAKLFGPKLEALHQMSGRPRDVFTRVQIRVVLHQQFYGSTPDFTASSSIAHSRANILGAHPGARIKVGPPTSQGTRV